MAGGLAREGDLLGPGGVMVGNAASSVEVNGRPVALTGIFFTPHPPCSPKKFLHCFGIVFDFDGGLEIEGQIPVTKGGKGTCGHGVQTASEDVLSMGGGGFLGVIVGMALGALGSSDAFSIEGTDFADSLGGVFDTVNSVDSFISPLQNNIVGQIGLSLGIKTITGS